MSNETLNLLLKQENNLLKNQVTALETKNLTSEQYGEVRTLYIENAILKESYLIRKAN